MPRNNELAIGQNWSINFCTARQTQDQKESQKSNDSLTTSYTDRENGARELHSWAAGLLGNRARLQSASLAPSTEPCPLYTVMEMAGDPASLFHRNKDYRTSCISDTANLGSDKNEGLKRVTNHQSIELDLHWRHIFFRTGIWWRAWMSQNLVVFITRVVIKAKPHVRKVAVTTS